MDMVVCLVIVMYGIPGMRVDIHLRHKGYGKQGR